jgi:hypothetical protein
MWKWHNGNGKRNYDTVPSHPIFMQLREFHGKTGKLTRKRVFDENS